MPTARNRVASSLLAIAIMHAVSCAPAPATDTSPRQFDIPAQSLPSALLAIGTESGRQILFPGEKMGGISAPAIHGTYTPDEAVRRLIAGTGFSAEFTPEAVYIRGRSTEAPTLSGSQQAEHEILVTGSRIRGAAVASPVVHLSQQDFHDAGQASIADVLRDIPQNFGGGQNPGVGLNVPEGKGLNVGSGTTINLRGLGPDATLTLLNGHRLAYNVANQAVDVSSIPLTAVDRIEIVADGASALYGSDAVAGVANIILRRDYSGVITTARFGTSTDGGNQQQQYSVLGGHKWRTGGIMAAYEYDKDTPIIAADRDYARSTSPGLTLFPSLEHHSAIVTAHQEIASNLVFEVDGLYNQRWSNSGYALTSAGNISADGVRQFFSTRSLALSPTFRLSLPHSWEIAVTGLIGSDRSRYGSDEHDAGRLTTQVRGCYCNTAYTAEFNATGPLFALPGGDAKLAIGGGYHQDRFHSIVSVGPVANSNHPQEDIYGFGELDLPLIGSGQNIPLVSSLHFTGALRYERYPGIDNVATPKLGVVYSPVSGLDIKGSWGKSFKAPTLYQRYSTAIALLYPAAAVGGTGYPSNATALMLLGGNPDLKPERATTWAITTVAHPNSVPGLRLELGYFNIHYRNRVVSPITYRQAALSNPIYSDLVTLDPSATDIARALDGRVFLNATGQPLNPASVVAIANSLNLNVASQFVDGVDFNGTYEMDLAKTGKLRLEASTSYLHSTQKLSGGQPLLALAGQIFNPPHWRSRAGAVWSRAAFSLSGFVNYIGGETDARTTQLSSIGSMTTTDFTFHYMPQNSSTWLHGLDLEISIQNAFDTKPPLIKTTYPYDTPYDSTNYSSFGRFISVSVTEKW